MIFSSIPFLYYFLPAVLLLYAITPKAAKNLVLLLSSLIFYGWGEPRHLIVMIISIVASYVFARLIEDNKRKTTLILSIAVGLAPLLYFKYANFALDNFRALTGLPIPVLAVTLPVGISFYTFQNLSYTVDVYRGHAKAQRSIIKLAMYIAMFPQLVAGPIVRYTDVEASLSVREHGFENMALGLRRFALGMGKKILIANRLGELVDLCRATEQPTVLGYWIYAITFTLQIYFDFSAYSDMAIGLGRMLGFHFPENFNYPFVSRSITEFWRRWHISLGSWFRDYIYIPLGGNRVSALRWIRNIVVVWLLTGLWHGAAWNFVLWGAYFIVFLLVEKRWLAPWLAQHRALSHLYTMFFIVISMVIFNATSMADIGASLAGMFGVASLPLASAEIVFYLRSFAVTLVLAVVASTPLVHDAVMNLRKTNLRLAAVFNFVEPLFIVLLILAATAYLVDGSFNPFLYFRF